MSLKKILLESIGSFYILRLMFSYCVRVWLTDFILLYHLFIFHKEAVTAYDHEYMNDISNTSVEYMAAILPAQQDHFIKVFCVVYTKANISEWVQLSDSRNIIQPS